MPRARDAPVISQISVGAMLAARLRQRRRGCRARRLILRSLLDGVAAVKALIAFDGSYAMST